MVSLLHYIDLKVAEISQGQYVLRLFLKTVNVKSSFVEVDLQGEISTCIICIWVAARTIRF